jgi:hypothetical protein
MLVASRFRLSAATNGLGDAAVRDRPAAPGAGIAAALITETTHEALRACKELYKENLKIVHWTHRKYLSKPRFAQNTIYPQWLREFLGPAEFLKLQNSTFKVSVAKLDNQRRKHWTVLTAACRYLMNRDNVKWPKTQPPTSQIGRTDRRLS